MIYLKSTIRNINGEYVEIEVIRYFKNNDIEYLIYSLNEIDASGYTKLYASKIIGSKACVITDEEEWTLVKEIIKQIVKCNRDGSPVSLIDLDESGLKNIVLQDTRVFKLQGNLVNLLAENKNIVSSFDFDDIDEDKDSSVFDNAKDLSEQNDNLDDYEINGDDTLNDKDDFLNDLNSEEKEEIDYQSLYSELLIENKKIKDENEFLKKYQDKIIRIEEILK